MKFPFITVDQLNRADWEEVEPTPLDGTNVCLTFRGRQCRKNPQMLYWWNKDGITDYKWDIKRFTSNDEAVAFIRHHRGG